MADRQTDLEIGTRYSPVPQHSAPRMAIVTTKFGVRSKLVTAITYFFPAIMSPFLKRNQYKCLLKRAELRYKYALEHQIKQSPSAYDNTQNSTE